MKISLAIIAKNNEDTLIDLLESVKGIFDEIVVVDTGSTDRTVKIAEEYNASVHTFKWIDDFSAARTYAFEQCTGDWIMWLDTDDVVEGAENIRELIEKADTSNAKGLSFPYHYAFDEDGNPTTILYRERAVKKGCFEWKGRIHEVLVKRKTAPVVKSDEVVVKHQLSIEHHNEAKSLRNLRILYEQMKDELTVGDPDPRTLYYIGNTLFGMDDWAKSAEYYYRYVQVSGWDEEMYHAWVKISICERKQLNFDKAVWAATNAWHIFPDAPDAYMHIGWTFQDTGEHKKAVKFLETALRMGEPSWETFYNPRDSVINPLMMLANSYIELGKLDLAIEAHEDILSITPNAAQSLAILEKLREIEADKRTANEYYDQFKTLKDEKEIEALYKSIPKKYRSFPSVIKIRNSFDIKKATTGKDVVIHCGSSFEEWTPESVANGIGGSEEATINLSRELALLGYNVTVFNAITEAKKFDGVWYRPWWEFNSKDKIDVFISWRNVALFDADINATKKYLWLHDLANPNDYIPERLEQIDKILVLSEFHRSNLEDIPDEKFYITSNGVDSSLFEKEVERVPYRFIWTSAYDRGLEHLLDMWPTVRKRYPTAELIVCYGWKTFDAQWENNPEKLAWKKMMVEKLDQKGVTELGRISHDKVADEMLKADIWAYPSIWPETSCITAMKAQIAGCIPVVSTLAALNETVQHGVKVDEDMETEEGRKIYLEKLMDVLESRETFAEGRKDMQNDIRNQYHWGAIAKSWGENLLTP